MRYEGQAFDLEIALTPEEINNPELAKAKFHSHYEHVFGISQAEGEVMFISLRVSVVGVVPSNNSIDHEVEAHQSLDENELEERMIVFDNIPTTAKVCTRTQIPLDDVIQGPVIIEEYDTTIFIPAGFTVFRDIHGNLIGEMQ
ncbi:hypothetical protein D3C75_1062770 [compost metagenome]